MQPACQNDRYSEEYASVVTDYCMGEGLTDGGCSFFVPEFIVALDDARRSHLILCERGWIGVALLSPLGEKWQ